MKNRFFFLTTYDSYSAGIATSILNQHPDIHCAGDYADIFLDASIDEIKKTTIDTFSEANTDATKPFSGNVARYSAFELQNNILSEKTRHPVNAATLTVAPELRIQLLLQSWRQAASSDALALQHITAAIKKQSQHFLIKSYKFDYFLKRVLNELMSVNSTLNGADTLFALALARTLAQDSADLPVPRRKFSLEKIISSDAEALALFHFISQDEIDITTDFKEKLALFLATQRQTINPDHLPPLTATHTRLIDKLIHEKLETIYFPHVDLPLAYYYTDAGYHFSKETPGTAPYTKLISIQLNSNRPAQIAAYFDNLEATADNPADIEVLVNIDIGDDAMKTLLEQEIPQRQFTLKFVESIRPASFCDLWKPINRLLEITDPGSYFLVNVSDEMLFATQGWDTILKQYVGLFPDHLFRLRASRYKFRNYFDRWECSFAQDCIPITTKKWVTTGGDWNPCFGPDSFQQLVAFYLAREGMFSTSQYLREMPLTDISFAGDVPLLGINPDKHWRHIRDHIKSMFICQSPAMQLEARRRAMLIKAQILTANVQQNHTIVDDKRKKTLIVHETESHALAFKIDYSVSRFNIFIVNQWRKTAFFSYLGDGIYNRKTGFLRGFIQYLKARHLLIHIAVKNLRGMFSLMKKLLYRLRGKKYGARELSAITQQQ